MASIFGLFYWYLIELPILLGQGIAVVILAAVSRQRGWIIGAAVALALTILAPFLLSEISHAIAANKDIFNPQSEYDADVRLFQAQLVFTVVLFALQLLYLAYGVRRIWRSTWIGESVSASHSAPVDAVLTGSSVPEGSFNRQGVSSASRVNSTRE